MRVLRKGIYRSDYCYPLLWTWLRFPLVQTTQKGKKIGWAVEETNRQKVFAASDIQIEVIQQKDFLSIKEAYTLLGISERTFFRLLKTGTIPAARLGGRTIIKEA
jgi:excisionase family DNA binding protein